MGGAEAAPLAMPPGARRPEQRSDAMQGRSERAGRLQAARGGARAPGSGERRRRQGWPAPPGGGGGSSGGGMGAPAGRSRRGPCQACRTTAVDVGAHRPGAGRSSALGSRLSALGSRLSALGSRLSALGSRLSALGSRLSALGSRLSALGSRLSALGSRLSALGSRLSALGSRLSALGSRLSALGSRLLVMAAVMAAQPSTPPKSAARIAKSPGKPSRGPCDWAASRTPKHPPARGPDHAGNGGELSCHSATENT